MAGEPEPEAHEPQPDTLSSRAARGSSRAPTPHLPLQERHPLVRQHPHSSMIESVHAAHLQIKYLYIHLA